MVNEHEILSENKKDAIAVIIGKCQRCGFKTIPEPHQIKRGCEGGKYILRNLLWLGTKKPKACGCHDLMHEGEFK